MIVRVWSAEPLASDPEGYGNHFQDEVLGKLGEIDGFLGATLLRTAGDGPPRYVVLTRWSSLDAIKSFAGEDCTSAVVDPEAQRLLSSYDRTASHYEALIDTGLAALDSALNR
jgi:heme-degrading monooxygenase HmoA